MIETLKMVRVDPVMSMGTKKIFEEVADFGLDEIFKGQTPESLRRVLKNINQRKPFTSVA